MIDVNGTRYHLLLGRRDWAPLTGSETDLWWDETRAMVSLTPMIFNFPAPRSDRIPSLADRRGGDEDRFGHRYWIDEQESGIHFMPAHGHEAQRLWTSAPATKSDETEGGADDGSFRPVSTREAHPLRLRGLAVTPHHYLVVGIVDPPGLLLFDLHAGGEPTQLLWPTGVPFAPLDMAAGPDGSLFILDANGRYWALDRSFRVLRGSPVPGSPMAVPTFEPLGNDTPGQRSCLPETAITVDASFTLESGDAVAITALPDGSVLILESDPALSHSIVHRYSFAERWGEPLRLDEVLIASADVAAPPEDSLLWGVDMAFVPESPEMGGQQATSTASGTLYVAASDGNQAFAFSLRAEGESWELAAQPRYLPLRRFSGVGLVAGRTAAAYHTLQGQWLPLVEQPRPRYHPTATFETEVFDGRTPDCVWHRLFLDGAIPAGTEVVVESRAANDEASLSRRAWRTEPALYRRQEGSELPYYQTFTEKEQAAGYGTWELLFQEAIGRYLQLRVTLRGGGRNTPRIRALRTYYPRFSYAAEYLPAAYGYDPLSFSFLERFLANPEGIFTVIEGRIAEVQTLFDVETTPAEYLEWLASWLGVTLEPGWDEARRRLFLRHAMEMFNQRGTVPGLVRAIRLATDPCPTDALFEEDVLHVPAGERTVRIVERFLVRDRPGVVYGDPQGPLLPQRSAQEEAWTPAQGAGALHQRYRAFLREEHPPTEIYPTEIAALNGAWGSAFTSYSQVRFSALRPSKEAVARDWDAFRQTGLSFTYTAVRADDVGAQESYQGYLAQRYRSVSALNESYRWTGADAISSFAEIGLPAELPSGAERLYDWVQFVSLILPTEEHAHRFTVLVPTDTESDDLAALQERLGVVERIVELEKPAHTAFEVKPYWAMFRVGEARVGLDTVIDDRRGFMALLLGSSYLAEGYLATKAPWNVLNRMVAGRDRLGQVIQL